MKLLSPQKRGFVSGFTLIECVIAIILVSILSALAFPSLQSLFNHSQEKILQQTIIELIQFSQDQAVAQSKNINLKLNEKNEMIVSANSELMKRKLNLANGKLYIRSFPYYRDYLQFTVNENDNGTIEYFKNDKIVWAIVLSATGRIRTESRQSWRA